MSPLIALLALCTPLNVIDGYQKKGRFVRELIIWKMQSQGSLTYFTFRPANSWPVEIVFHCKKEGQF